MYSFGRMFEIFLSPENIVDTVETHLQGSDAAAGGAPSMKDHRFEGGIIVQPEASRSLIFIFRNATRYEFVNRDELRTYGLEGVHIHTDVPYEVISAFPPVF